MGGGCGPISAFGDFSDDLHMSHIPAVRVKWVTGSASFFDFAALVSYYIYSQVLFIW